MPQNLFAQYRKEAGLTQTEVGDLIGVSAQAISKWENGHSEPDIATLRRLAELYHISVDELVGNAGAPDTAEETDGALTDPTGEAPPAKKKKKLLPWILIAVAVVVAAVVIAVIISALSNAGGIPSKDAYLEIELGMTKEEVEEILGAPKDTYVLGPAFGIFSGMMDESQYGYTDAEFWYYYDNAYEKNEEKLNDVFLGDTYLPLPCKKIRITFKDGKVVETYYNVNPEVMSLFDDYQPTEKDKKLKSVTPLSYNGLTYYKLTFSDGSIYLGKADVENATEDPDGQFEHPWGNLTLPD